jgi:hypothetical protein
MRAKRVMSENLTRTKTGGNRYRVDAFDANRARTQDNQILISAYDEILSRMSSYNCLMIGELPVRPRVFHGFSPDDPCGDSCAVKFVAGVKV